MKKRGLIFTLFLLCIFLFHSPVLSQGFSTSKRITQYKLDSWMDVQGLKHNSIIDICQTRDGYLWLSTYTNLYRFDGITFKSYPAVIAPRSLYEDSGGRLWIGTTSGIFIYSNGVFSRFPGDTVLNTSVIQVILERSNGTMLFGFAAGVASFDGKKIIDRSSEYNVRGTSVWSLVESSDQTVWIGTDHGIRKIYGTTVETIDTSSASLRHNVVRTILEDRFGSIWIGTAGGGITRFRSERHTIFSTADGLSSNVIRELYEDNNGSIWIGTSGGGLSRYRNGRFETLTSNDGLTTDVIWALCQDREGSLWIGTGGGGLNRIKDSRFTALTKKEGIGNNFLWTTYEDSRGRQWLGTNGSGVTLWENGTAQSVLISNNPLSNIVRTVLDDRNGTIWIGTSAGLYRSPINTPLSFTQEKSIQPKMILTLTQSSDKSIWVGTNDNGVSIMQRGMTRRLTHADGLLSNTVHAIAHHPDGNVWIGTNKGISILREQSGTRTWKYLTKTEGFYAEETREIYIDQIGVVWIGTDTQGLVRYDNGRITQYSEAQGYDARTVHEIQEDDLGYFWISCNKGIFRVQKHELEEVAAGKKEKATFSLYGTIDGMGSSECNGGGQPAGWKMRNGTIWFPTMKGATIVSPQHLPFNTIVPPVYIENISADGRTAMAENNSVDVEAGANRLIISYSCLSMLAPELVKFKYTLEGYDKEWIDGGNSRTASYTSVPPGTYRFKVIASNNDGVWNTEGATATIVIHPFFYQTWYFTAALTLLISVVGFSVYQYRISSLKQRERELKALVDDRTRHLQVEKERAEKANQIKSDLVHIVAHDLKNPLTTIYGMSGMLDRDRSDSETVKLASHAIARSSEQMMNLIQDFLNIEAMESGKIELKKVELSLSDLAGYVVSMTSNIAERKHQRIALHLCPIDKSAVVGDSERLYQVIENYISNAVKYSPRESVIEVSVERLGAAVRLSVTDHGQGLTDEDQKKLFNKFQKLASKPTDNETSTGLGLSIVKLLVELHGGSVGATSALGKGSTFFFDLPVTS